PPEDTNTTSTPRLCRAMTWSVMRRIRSRSGTLVSDVRLDVPSLTTTRFAPAGRSRGPLAARAAASAPSSRGVTRPSHLSPDAPAIGGGPPLEGRSADAHVVAGMGARSGEGPLHAGPVEPLLEVRHRLGVAEVAHGHPALHGAAPDPPCRLVTLDAERAALGTEQLEARGPRRTAAVRPPG